jgi:hypothetical protein
MLWKIRLWRVSRKVSNKQKGCCYNGRSMYKWERKGSHAHHCCGIKREGGGGNKVPSANRVQSGVGMQCTWQHLKVLWPAIPVRVNGGHGRKVTKEKVNVCIWYLQKARNTKLPVLHVKRELLIRIFMLLQSTAGKISVCSQWSFDVFLASFLLLPTKIS